MQIAPYEAIVHERLDSIWAEIRDAQLHVSQNVPSTALVVTTDVGDESDIHPRRKEPVGMRLALAARAVAYGEKIEHFGADVRQHVDRRRQGPICASSTSARAWWPRTDR